MCLSPTDTSGAYTYWIIIINMERFQHASMAKVHAKYFHWIRITFLKVQQSYIHYRSHYLFSLNLLSHQKKNLYWVQEKLLQVLQGSMAFHVLLTIPKACTNQCSGQSILTVLSVFSLSKQQILLNLLKTVYAIWKFNIKELVPSVHSPSNQ